MTRQFWIGLLIGLVIGWAIEWIIDRIYWRNLYHRVETQLAETKDRLRDIKGVGMELEEKLNQAGVYSFKAMAALTRQELEEIAGHVKGPADIKDLIKRAGKRAKKKRKGKKG